MSGDGERERKSKIKKMLVDYFVIAWKNLSNKKLRSWLTVIGIFIGVVAVVSLISLGDGLRTAITSQFGISSTEVISVQAGGLTGYGPPGTGVVSPLTEQDVEAIRKLNTVERAIRRNIVSGKLEFNDKVVFGFATNLPDGSDKQFVYDLLELEPEIGRLLKDGDTDKVVLGNNFYTDKVGLGKKVLPGDVVLIQDKKFEVVGITKKKGSFIFDNIVYVNEKPLGELMKYGDKVDVIGVKVKSKELLNKAKEDIEKLMRKRRDVKEGEEDFQVITPQAALSTVNQVLLGVQIFVSLIAFISIVVGAIGIINTMTTAVLERKRQIGIMKAIGAKNSDIFLQFFIESGLMGLIGGFIGVIFGVTIGYFGTMGINNFVGSQAKPSIDFILVAFTLIGSFIIGCIAGIIPAMNAAKQKPVDSLRG